MTQKADEPRVLVKMPFSLRERVRKNAKKENKSMMDYLESVIPKQPRYVG